MPPISLLSDRSSVDTSPSGGRRKIRRMRPEVRGKINPLRNSWAIELVVGSAHQDLPYQRRAPSTSASLTEPNVKADANQHFRFELPNRQHCISVSRL